MIGDDLVAEALGLECVRVVAEDLAHPLVDRGEEIGVVVRGHLLDDARDALEAQAGVDAGRRQRRERSIRVELELHEDQVPDLEPARARLGVIGDAEVALAELRSSIEVDLAARTARPDVRHAPPVLLVTVGEVAPTHEPLRRQPDLVLPDPVGEVVGRVHGRRETLARECPRSRVMNSQAQWIASRLK